MDKPVIKFWGNGDVLMSCVNTYSKCYPGKMTTYRSPPFTFDRAVYKAVKNKVVFLGAMKPSSYLPIAMSAFNANN